MLYCVLNSKNTNILVVPCKRQGDFVRPSLMFCGRPATQHSPPLQERGFCSTEGAPLGRPPFLKLCRIFGPLCHGDLVCAGDSESGADEVEAEGVRFDGRLYADDDLLRAGGCIAARRGRK